MSIFTKIHIPANMMLGKPSSQFCIPVAGQYQNNLALKIWSKYPFWFKSYEHFHSLTTTGWTNAQLILVHQNIWFGMPVVRDC